MVEPSSELNVPGADARSNRSGRSGRSGSARGSARGSSRTKASSARNRKVRKVNGYIIFFDEVIGQGQFGTVVKA